LSPARRRAFIAVTLVLPLLLVTSLEAALRVAGYGPDLSLFVTQEIRGRTYLAMNPDVKHRYFARVPFNPSTSPDLFLMPKPAGSFRIFCLGGSTTVGYPFWFNGAFSTFLRERLARAFPDRPVEVINVGMTATNSFTTLDMARDLMEYEPDLLLVYDGHNEFYGALGAASRESFRTPRWLTNLSLRAIHLRTFLLVRDAIAGAMRLAGSEEKTQPLGTMMEKLARGQFIPYGSTTYLEGLETFRANLRDLAALCRDRGVPLILSTQVSNLRDLQPFVSGGSPHLPTGAVRERDEALNRSMTALMNGDPGLALEAAEQAATIDSVHAETCYRLARVLDTLGRDADARAQYMRARDLDQLRFRTSSDFNDVIRAQDDGGACRVVDMERVFMEHSPDSLIGGALMFEHLHPRSSGYFLMADAFADVMRSAELVADASVWGVRDTMPLSTLWNERVLTPLDELTAERRTEVLMSGWPFRDQFPIVDPVDTRDTLAVIADRLVRAQVGWEEAHEQAAAYYLGRGDLAMAALEYRTIVSQLPRVSVRPYLRLARVLLDMGNPAEVERVLRASLTVEPTILAYRALGDLAFHTRRPKEAAEFYELTFTFPQPPAEQVENGTLLALAYERAGMPAKAEERIMRVLALKPDHREGVELLRRLRAGATDVGRER
jgi:tetratricopeptide (TPR) repeat protein